MSLRFLITGGLGYIGSFTAKNFLKKTGNKVLSIDDLSRGNKFSQKFSKNIVTKLTRLVNNEKSNKDFHDFCICWNVVCPKHSFWSNR